MHSWLSGRRLQESVQDVCRDRYVLAWVAAAGFAGAAHCALVGRPLRLQVYF